MFKRAIEGDVVRACTPGGAGSPLIVLHSEPEPERAFSHIRHHEPEESTFVSGLHFTL
ncbi:MAG: hypothetical protein ACOY3J_13210 [Bacillota bacterium]|uniref:Uncharacterized protein n=1 Tax=Thermanaerosceptrum fracticalcis TaxID=1712410 RepID=A0A7G6E2K8_THEFR|nr:hypothetical protein [Thermanaerosceptrum fracticalcis]QNB46312.1 hypothetical protein BR63_08295 [Thermanaerosceptrum fracticalcis]